MSQPKIELFIHSESIPLNPYDPDITLLTAAPPDPYQPAQHCPFCNHLPLSVRGDQQSMNIAGHDYYMANAYCVDCRQIVGRLKITMSTLFGLQEDEAVLKRGRCRVY